MVTFCPRISRISTFGSRRRNRTSATHQRGRRNRTVLRPLAASTWIFTKLFVCSTPAWQSYVFSPCSAQVYFITRSFAFLGRAPLILYCFCRERHIPLSALGPGQPSPPLPGWKFHDVNVLFLATEAGLEPATLRLWPTELLRHSPCSPSQVYPAVFLPVSVSVLSLTHQYLWLTLCPKSKA